MCKEQCRHIKQPPNVPAGIDSGGVYQENRNAGEKKKNLSSLLNNTAAIKCALSHCVSHSVYNQIGEIKGGTAERDDGYLGEPARRHQSFQLRQLYDL